MDKWEFHSVRDAFENGTFFAITKGRSAQKPNYSKEQCFKVVDVKSVRSLTRSSNTLQCSKTSIYKSNFEAKCASLVLTLNPI